MEGAPVDQSIMRLGVLELYFFIMRWNCIKPFNLTQVSKGSCCIVFTLDCGWNFKWVFMFGWKDNVREINLVGLFYPFDCIEQLGAFILTDDSFEWGFVSELLNVWGVGPSILVKINDWLSGDEFNTWNAFYLVDGVNITVTLGNYCLEESVISFISQATRQILIALICV